jgi:hypothetical protein
MRLALLLASAAAFLLVPVAVASAASATIKFEGEGSGWVKEIPLAVPGSPPIECHWNGTEIDVGVPSAGECVQATVGEEPPFPPGIVATHEQDPGSLFGGWKIIEGTEISCTQESPAAGNCGVVTFGGPIVIKATFNAEPVPPSNVTPPTISGTAKIGKTLKGNAGTWKGAPETFTYQWLRCDEAGENCVPIAGAEGTEYEVTEADAESTLRFEETATNGQGSDSATSAQTAVVPKAGGGETEDSKEGEVYGEVEQTTSLESVCEEVFLGVFLPGVEADYENSCNVVATSTGQESALSAADENAEAVGHLVNGSYSLAQSLEVQATDTESLGGVSTGFGTLDAGPYTLLDWAVPVSADTVQVDFKQPIGLHDPLHHGTYSKVITLTLQQTLP